VDLGVRNLAWCVLDREPSSAPEFSAEPFNKMSIRVRSWKCIDVTQYAPAGLDISNLNKVDIADCVPMFVAALRAHRDELTQIDVALLETQPVGRVFGGTNTKLVSNVKTKVLSHILQAFLLEHGVPVIKFVSAKLKLSWDKSLPSAEAEAEATEAPSYRDKKQAAIQLVTRIGPLLGTDLNSRPWSEIWSSTKGKKDDLADCLLQGIVAGREKIRVSKPRAKKPKPASEPDLELVPDIE